MDGLVSSRGGGRLSTVPCVRLYIAGRGWLSTIPFVRFYIAEGGTALYRPLCSFLYSRGEGTALYRPLCSVVYSGGEGTALYCPGQLSTVPCVRFSIAEGGDGYLPSPVFGFI